MAGIFMFIKAKWTTKDTSDSLLSSSVICIVLIAAIIIVYIQVVGFGFINLDDPGYVSSNDIVKQGITPEGIRWAVSTFHKANWHPLTWVSHMLDVQFFGMNPGMHHLTNVIFHILNTLMLFFVLKRMTGTLWRSAAVAALFALHPLHVESVAWISERKDVLSTFFWLLTMMGYVWYVQRCTVRRYLVVVLSFVLGLLSKPMLVTLPFVLVLLDFWPLKRWDPFLSGSINNDQCKRTLRSRYKQQAFPILIAEKIPLIVLALVSSVITFYAQKSGGAVSSVDSIAIGTRLANAITSYAAYLDKMIRPYNLAVFYPYMDAFNFVTVSLSALLLILITTVVLLAVRKKPYLAVGWLWYLGTLIPVIGIVQVGSQSMADRYTYIPLIGVFVMIVWGIVDLLGRQRYGKTVLRTATLVFPLFIWVSWVQAGLWKNNETLFMHALDVTKNNYIMHYNLGITLYEQGDVDGAVREYQESLKIKPDLAEAHNNLGSIVLLKGYPDVAIRHYLESLRVNPYQTDIYNDLGAAYLRKGNIPRAIECFQEAIREKSDNAEAIRNLEIARTVKNKHAGLNQDDNDK
jgi:tetratricopeptide (TPR) repeat protein